MRDFRRRAALALFVLLCSLGTICSLARISHLGNNLPDVDPFSEANTLREVRHFLEDGLTKNLGLGTVYYAGLYDGIGFVAGTEVAAPSVTEAGVYTHYPPGPEYLAYVMARLMGPEPVSRLRLLPVILGLAAMLSLGFAVRARFGATSAWVTMGACAITPCVTDGFIGLHAQGYAAALLMIEIALILRSGRARWPFLLLGFLQGWLSFDYVFLVIFSPLAMEAALRRIDCNHSVRWRLAWWRVALAAIGFAAAHGLHFLQVAAWWGSFAQARADLGGAAAHRAGAGLFVAPADYFAVLIGVLKSYFHGLHPLNLSLTLPEPETPVSWSMFRFLGLSLGPWWLVVTVLLMIRDAMTPDTAHRGMRMDWHRVCLIGLLTSSGWFIAMIGHAIEHGHFLYRHLFFAFFVMLLFVAVRVPAILAAWLVARGRQDGLSLSPS